MCLRKTVIYLLFPNLPASKKKSWKVEAVAAGTPGKQTKRNKEKKETTRKNDFFLNLGGKNGIEAAAGLTGRGSGGGGDSTTGPDKYIVPS